MHDSLDAWLNQLAVNCAATMPAMFRYVDQVAGDELSVTFTQGSKTATLIVTRIRRGRGRIAFFASDLEHATAVAALLSAQHQQVSRFANRQRKFVHRLAIMANELVRHRWQAAVLLAQTLPAQQAMQHLLAFAPQAEWLYGYARVTEETEVARSAAAANPNRPRKTIKTVQLAALIRDVTPPYTLPYQAAQGRFAIRANTLVALAQQKQQPLPANATALAALGLMLVESGIDVAVLQQLAAHQQSTAAATTEPVTPKESDCFAPDCSPCDLVGGAVDVIDCAMPDLGGCDFGCDF